MMHYFFEGLRMPLPFQGRRLCPLFLMLISMLAVLPTAKAELRFNVNALRLTPEQKAMADLELLSRPDVQIPGEYRVQVTINQTRQGEYSLKFVVCESRLCPELTPALLEEFGVKVAAFPGLAAMSSDVTLSDIGSMIPQASAELDLERRVLKLSIPQAALDNRARGDIPPERWDSGLPMLFTTYSASGYEVKNRVARNQTSTQYLNLRSGANLGEWRLRNYSYYSRTRQRQTVWNSMQTWIERDIRTLRSRFVAGEASSPGLVFDSFSFRGASLSSQDEMQPDSQQGYAPEIRGVAITNAKVEVRQNGNLLYQTFVPPGAFVINDMYATSTSGDMEITIEEEDGTVRTFTQAFASPPISVRKGVIKYSTTTGEYHGQNYRNNRNAVSQRFVQAELLYGLLNTTSVYGGITAASRYRSGVMGIGQGMGDFGAVSLDVTYADTTFSDGTSRAGQSLQAKYSKRFNTTGTSMTLAGYRYATDGFFSFSEASNYYYGSSLASRYSLKSKAQITLSQNMNQLGSVALSAYQSEYWYRGQSKTRSMTGSWSKSFGGVSVSLNQSQSKIWRTGKTDNTTSLNVSLPLGKWLSPSVDSNIRMSNNWSHSDRGTNSLTSTLSGTAMADNNLSWMASQGRSQRSSGATTDSTAVSGAYRGGRATAGLGYSNYYGRQEAVNWSLRGSIVAHPYGITLSQQLSEGSGYALVRAPAAEGVKINNRSGLVTDWRGYAVLPTLTAYRENEISLDTATLRDDVDLTDALQRKVPTREALVLADYDTRIGHRVFATLTHNGKPLPLGTQVSVGDSEGIVNEHGQVYLTGVTDSSFIIATLAENQHCSVPFHAKETNVINGIFMITHACDEQ
ncbi:fimbria/pilus outer membrane usher protein [Lonsdalea quercina]|uniref:fimbria/pilus outer membrane usher protein n=1 Tax=Lonsdalea quercina TaxID=71657 RepID=UPI0039756769